MEDEPGKVNCLRPRVSNARNSAPWQWQRFLNRELASVMYSHSCCGRQPSLSVHIFNSFLEEMEPTPLPLKSGLALVTCLTNGIL